MQEEIELLPLDFPLKKKEILDQMHKNSIMSFSQTNTSAPLRNNLIKPPVVNNIIKPSKFKRNSQRNLTSIPGKSQFAPQKVLNEQNKLEKQIKNYIIDDVYFKNNENEVDFEIVDKILKYNKRKGDQFLMLDSKNLGFELPFYTYVDFSKARAISDFKKPRTISDLSKKIEISKNSQQKNKIQTEFSIDFLQEVLGVEKYGEKSPLGFHPEFEKFELRPKYDFLYEEKKKILTKQESYDYYKDFLRSTIDLNDNEFQNINEDSEIPDLYRDQTRFFIKNNKNFLGITEMNAIEKVIIDYETIPDKYPLRKFRKYIVLTVKYIQKYTRIIVISNYFSILSLIIVFSNCCTYTLQRNQKGQYLLYKEEIKMFEFFFFIFYLIEMGLKMIAHGIILKKESYFRNGWNLLDFVVIASLLLIYTNVFTSIDLSLFKSLKILGPLRTITKIEQIRLILSAFFTTLPLFVDTMIIVLFFFFIYSTAGLQLFSGILKFRCMDIQTGMVLKADDLCGIAHCTNDEICVKLLKNPFLNVISFDNIFSSFLQIILIITLEEWSFIMIQTQKSFSNLIWPFFISLVFLGTYVLNNLLLAVIKVKFSESHLNLSKNIKIESKIKIYDFNLIKREGLWKKRNNFQFLKEKFVKNKINNNNIPQNNAKSPLPFINRLRQNVAKNSVFSLISPSHQRSSDYNSDGNSDMNSPFNLKSPKKNNFLDKIQYFAFSNSNLIRLLNYPRFQRKKTRQSSNLTQNLNPKYLKIVINENIIFEAFSKLDVLPRCDEKELKFQMEQELKMIKNKKMPIIYTMKKNNNLIFSLLNKLYSRNFSMSNSLGHNYRTSQELLTFLQKKIKTKIQKNENDLNKKSFLYKKMLSKKKKNLANNKNNELTTIFLKGNKEQRKIDLKSLGKSLITFKNKEIKGFDEDTLFSSDLKTNYEQIKNIINSPINLNDDNENEGIENKKVKILEKDMTQKYLDIWKKDYSSSALHSFVWSGEDILPNSFMIRKFETIFKSLNLNNFLIFKKESKGKILKLKIFLIKIIESYFYSNLLNIIIFSCILLSALEGMIDISVIYISNYIFSGFFSFETFCKIIAYGFSRYFTDKLNSLDLFILFCSLLELSLLNSPISAGYRYIRFLTASKIFRMLRLLKNITFLRLIVEIIIKTLSSFIYLLILLILFNFVYAMIGMELFGGLFDRNDEKYNDNNFDTFWVAYLNLFNIMTLNNWIQPLKLIYNSKASKLIGSFYIISWILVGNLILFNLFLAIMLDAFTQNLHHQEENEFLDQEHIESEENNYIKNELPLNQDMTIYIPKDAREAFMDDLTKNYIKYTRLNPTKKNNEANLILNIILENTNYEIKPPSLNDGFCKYSLLIFAKDSILRNICFKILNHKLFNFAIYIAIFIASFFLVLETFINKLDNQNSFTLLTKIVNIFVFILFVFEIILKLISYGCFLGKKCFFRDFWNILDFFIILSYIADFRFTIEEGNNLMLIEIIMLIRTFRPLRFINLDQNLNLILKALIESSSGILNVLLLIFTVWIAYGVLGIIIFRSRFGYCENFLNFGISYERCPNGLWKNHKFNFDNIFNALLTLFVVSTLDNWSEIMNIGVNSNTSDQGPIEFNNQFSSYIYFLSFLMIGNFLLLNLFIGVLFYNFSLASHKNKHRFLTESQHAWVKLQNLIIFAEPNYIYTKPPLYTVKYYCYNLSRSKFFRQFFNFCLIFNSIFLAMPYDGSNHLYSYLIEVFVFIFNILLIFEALIKCYGIGLKAYFYNSWNKFEFFVALSAILDILIQKNFYILINQQIGIRIIKAIRVFKILRLLKLIKQKKGVGKLLYTLKICLPMVFNIISLLLLIYYIFAIMGYHFFKNITFYVAINEYVNFKNFSYALLTIFKVATADDWSSIMDELIQKKNGAVVIYFIFFYLLTAYILTNFFILILVQQFENFHLNPENPLHTFSDYLENFRNIWSLFTAKHKIDKIQKGNLVKFLTKLKKPLGIDKKIEIENILKEIANMNLFIDNDEFIHFNDLLFSSLKRVYKNQIEAFSNDISKKEIEKIEEKSLLKLQIKKKTKKKKSIKKLSVNTHRYLQNIMKQVKIYNPLPKYFMMKLILYTWKNYSMIVFDKLLKFEKNNIDYYESDESLDCETDYNIKKMLQISHHNSEF